MLSGKLGGLALVATVALVAGGISIGIYFAVQSFRDGDDDSRVDTTDWLTHSSPLGFSLLYPPDWRVLETPGYTHLANSVWNQAFEEGMETGDFLAVAGMAVVYARPVSLEFDSAALIESCEDPLYWDRSGPQAQAELTTIAGRTAVFCLRPTHLPPGLESSALSLNLEFPPGQTFYVGGSAIVPARLATIEAILNSFSPASPR